MGIADSLLASVQIHPEKTALLYQNQRVPFTDLVGTVRLYAAVFREWNIGAGDIVAICFENSPEFIYSYYALAWLGATILPVNLLLAPKEIEYILRDCHASTVVTRRQYWPKFEAAAATGTLSVRQALLVEPVANGAHSPSTGTTPQPVSSNEASQSALIETASMSEQLTRHSPIDSAPADVPEDSLAVLIYTSGTTGIPKGVMLSHRNLTSNAAAVARATSALEQDTFFLLLPVFHITSQTVCMLTPLSIGASVAIVSKMDRAEMARAFREFRPTIFVAVPSIYNMLAAAPAPPPDQNPVRLYVSGGAPLPGEIENRFETAYQKPIYGGYGLTEASPVVSWNVPGANKPGSVGRPLCGVQIRIANEQMETLPHEEVGEICIKGDLVMLGYYKRPEETAQTIIDGWLLTGDMGYLDNDGFLYVVDRKKEMLIYSGINIYPREIEELLHTMPAISEAAVVGAPDYARGEIPVAFVTMKDSCQFSEKEIKDFCIASLARYKVPRRIFNLPEFPRTGSGKINKIQLKGEASERLKEVKR